MQKMLRQHKLKQLSQTNTKKLIKEKIVYGIIVSGCVIHFILIKASKMYAILLRRFKSKISMTRWFIEVYLL